MKKMVSGLVIATLTSLGAAYAEGGVYAGLTYSQHTAEYSVDDFTPSSIGGRVGYQNFFSEYGNGTGFLAGLEGRVATGASNSSVNDGNEAMELDTVMGAYLVLGYSTGIVTPYVLLGTTSAEGHFHNVANGYNNDFEDNSASFGIGLDYNIGEMGNVGIEYLNAVDEISDTGEALNSLNLVTKFKF